LSEHAWDAVRRCAARSGTAIGNYTARTTGIAAYLKKRRHGTL
jgi:hypothetical protein